LTLTRWQAGRSARLDEEEEEAMERLRIAIGMAGVVLVTLALLLVELGLAPAAV
jgi:hypothetical protein